ASTGERFLGNNAVHFPLRVDAEPIKVLYVEGFLRYEFKYLKARLEDDPDVGLVTVVRRVSPDLPEAKGGKELLTDEQLKAFAVVILGDMEANFFSIHEYQRLLRWLDGKNHSLLVLGGYRSLGPDGFKQTPLADVLSVVPAQAAPFQSEESFTLKLTPDGQ